MQQWKQENSFFRDPYDESGNFRSRPRKKLKTVTDWKELSQICSSFSQKIKFRLKNRAAVTKTITFLPSVLRLDDIEEFSEDRNQPLPTTQRPTHKNIHIKNEPSVTQAHVSFAADLRSSPSAATSHRPLLVKKERTPQKSILKNSNTRTSLSKENTVGKKRKRSDQIMEIYTDSAVLDDYDDLSDNIMYTYAYDDINLHNMQPVYNTKNVEQVQIKEEKIPEPNPNTLNNNNNTNTNNSDAPHKTHELYSEMSRVPDSLADLVLAKDSQPLLDAPTPSPHLSLALNTAIEEQLLSQKVQLIPSQMSAMNQRSSTSFGTTSHVSDSVSHPSTVGHKATNKRIELTYVDSQQSLHEHDHMSVEESDLESQSASNNKLLQDSYDDDAEVLNGNLLSLKRKNSLALMLSTKKTTNTTTPNKAIKNDVEIPLSTQQDDVPETLSYHSNQHKESETQKQVANAAAYTFVSLTNNKNGSDSHGNNKSPNRPKPKDVVELSSGDSSKNKEKTKKSAAVSKENDDFNDSLDDFDVAPRSVKKPKKSTATTPKKPNKKSDKNSSSNDNNKTIVIEAKKNKNNTNKTKTSASKKDKTKKTKSDLSLSRQENQNLKLLISQSSDEDNNSGSQNKVKSLDLSDFESSYAIYMPSSDDFM